MHEFCPNVIDKLEPDFRVVFVLRDIENFPGRNRQNAWVFRSGGKSRLLRARLKLRTSWNRYSGRVIQIECKSVIARFRNFIDGALEQRKSRLERHLEHCEDCKIVVDQTRADDRFFL